MRTNKNCPKYGEDPEVQLSNLDQEKELSKPMSPELSSQSQQQVSSKKVVTRNVAKPAPSEILEGEKSSLKTKTLKVRYASADKVPDTVISAPLPSSEQPSTSEAEAGNRSAPKVIKIISKNTKPDDSQAESSKPNVIIRPPSETGKEHKKITIRQPKEVINLDEPGQEGFDIEYRKTKKMVELTGFGINGQHQNSITIEKMRKKNKEARHMWEEEEKRRIREEQARRHYEEVRMLEEQERLAELRKYEEDIRREREEEEWRKANKKKKKKKIMDLKDDYLEDFSGKRNKRSLPGKDRSAKRKNIVDLGRFGAEYVPATKRRRGGEVFF